MDRQEPVIDLERSERNAKTLTDRIRLTWREVRDLMTDAPDDLPKEPTLGTAPAAERASKTPGGRSCGRPGRHGRGNRCDRCDCRERSGRRA